MVDNLVQDTIPQVSVSELTNMDRPQIVAAIPAFNEEKKIASIVIRARKYVDKVIVCDDGSSDMTAEIVGRLEAEVIRHERNMGKGVALQSLFKRARTLDADVVVTLDGDDQHDPDEIPMLVKPVLMGTADIVNGSRFLRNTEMPRHRSAGNKVLNLLTNVKLDCKLTDTQSGFRAYSRRALHVLDIKEKGIGVDSQILIDASAKSLKIIEVPVSVNYRDVKSTYNPIFHLWMVIDSIIGKIVEENPLIYLGLPGFIMVISGLLAGIRVVEIFMGTHLIAIGTAMVSVMLIVVGFLLMTAAIIVKTLNSMIEKLGKHDEY